MDKNSINKMIVYFFKIISIIVISSCTFEKPEIVSGPPDKYGMKLEQNGITWYFEDVYEHGRFANGDHYVVVDVSGTVKIIYIDPSSSSVGSRHMHGSQLNPIPIKTGIYDQYTHGYDSAINLNGFYNPSLNVGLDVTTKKPLTLLSGSSLVSTKSILNPTGRAHLADAAVLTVLASAPPAGSFRPPYCGTNKTINFNISDIKYSILPATPLSQSTNTTKLSSADVLEIYSKVRKVWIDHFVHQGEGTSNISPINNMPNYGREYCIMIGRASLLACMSDTELTALGITREGLLIGLIQIGIDTYEVLKNGGCWPENGGQNQGRKWPIMFAGALLGGATAASGPAYDMLHVMDFAFTPQNLQGGTYQMTTPFAEDQTIGYINLTDYTATHVAYWGDETHTPYIGPDRRADASIAYETTDYGLPEWGIVRMTSPSSSNKHWSSEYRTDCTGNAYAGIALVARIMESTAGTMSLWGNNAFFDYVDRFMAIQIKGDWQRSMSHFTENLWDKYRAGYGDGYVGQVYINGTTVITNCVNAATGYDGVTGTKVSGTTDTTCAFAINTSEFNSITGFAGSSYDTIDSNHYRIYGDCATYGIVK